MPADFKDATLLIIGHGSTVNGDSGATVLQHAAELRRRGLFADVREAFFKIEPCIGPTLAAIRTPRVFVVPYFTAEGYFTRQAIPTELGLPADALERAAAPAVFDVNGRRLFYCAPVGTHPLMTEIILARAESMLNSSLAGPRAVSARSASPARSASEIAGAAVTNHPLRTGTVRAPNPPDAGLQPRLDTALVLAAHGTPLNLDSRKSVERQVELVTARNLFAEVHTAFLEEEPRIAEIPRFVKASRIVVVPFFLSDGLHVCEDIPVLLGETEANIQARLKAGEWPWSNPTVRGDKTIFYTRGVGSEPGIADVILERVLAAAGR